MQFKAIAPIVGVLLIIGPPATAQTATVAAPAGAVATLVPITTVAGASVLHAGTSVPLRTVTNLTTEGKRLIVGTRFDLETTDAVRVNGAIVIPVGSHAIGEITQIRNKGMWGKSGGITARLLYVSVDGRQLRLSGTLADKGSTGTIGVVAAVAFIPVAGFLVTGTSARIPTGSSVTGFLEEDLPVVIAAIAAPAALVVNAPVVVAAPPLPAPAGVIPVVAVSTAAPVAR